MARHPSLVSPLLALVLAASISAPFAAADSDTLQAAHDRADAEYVEALMGIANWCKSSKLYGKRDDVCFLVLEFDSDHAKARKTLKFERGAEGWERKKPYKRAKDWTPKLYPKFDERMAEAWDAYRAAVLQVCASAKDSGELTWAASTLLRLLERAPDDAPAKAGLKATLLKHLELLRTLEVPIALDTVTQQLRTHFDGDPDVRRAFGEVERDGRWVLPATVRAESERPRVAAEATKALDAVPAVQVEAPTEEESAAGPKAPKVHVTEHMRVLGTTTNASLESIAKHCEAAGPFFDALFRVKVVRAPTRTFFVFTKYEDWTHFVETYGPISDEVRAHALTYKGSGYPLLTHVYVALPVGTPAAELDLCVDVTVQTLLNEAFAKWHADESKWQVLPGWVRVGMSDYLTWRLTGKRILTTAGEGKYGKGTATDDPSPKARTKWLQASLETFKRVRAPGMHLMLGKELSAFEGDDALTSFGLSNYLVEGRPDDVTKILREIGTGRPTAEVIKDVLGLPVEALYVEVVRWMEETIAGK